jgi:hypothetical protein
MMGYVSCWVVQVHLKAESTQVLGVADFRLCSLSPRWLENKEKLNPISQYCCPSKERGWECIQSRNKEAGTKTKSYCLSCAIAIGIGWPHKCQLERCKSGAAHY